MAATFGVRRSSSPQSAGQARPSDSLAVRRARLRAAVLDDVGRQVQVGGVDVVVTVAVQVERHGDEVRAVQGAEVLVAPRGVPLVLAVGVRLDAERLLEGDVEVRRILEDVQLALQRPAPRLRCVGDRGRRAVDSVDPAIDHRRWCTRRQDRSRRRWRLQDHEQAGEDTDDEQEPKLQPLSTPPFPPWRGFDDQL